MRVINRYMNHYIQKLTNDIQLGQNRYKEFAKGISFPPYEVLEELQKRKLGYYTGGFYDRWTWDLYNTKESDQKLFELYLKLKNK